MGKVLISRVVAKTEHLVRWHEQSRFTPTRNELCTSHNSVLRIETYGFSLAYFYKKMTVHNCGSVTSETDEEASSDSREQLQRNYSASHHKLDYLKVKAMIEWLISVFSSLLFLSLFCLFFF